MALTLKNTFLELKEEAEQGFAPVRRSSSIPPMARLSRVSEKTLPAIHQCSSDCSTAFLDDDQCISDPDADSSCEMTLAESPSEEQKDTVCQVGCQQSYNTVSIAPPQNSTYISEIRPEVGPQAFAELHNSKKSRKSRKGRSNTAAPDDFLTKVQALVASVKKVLSMTSGVSKCKYGEQDAASTALRIELLPATSMTPAALRSRIAAAAKAALAKQLAAITMLSEDSSILGDDPSKLVFSIILIDAGQQRQGNAMHSVHLFF